MLVGSYWGALAPYVHKHLARRASTSTATTWVLCHFSLRYTDEEVAAFFTDVARSGLRLAHRRRHTEDAPTSSAASSAASATAADDQQGSAAPQRAADLVLWLSSGVVELWVESMDLTPQADAQQQQQRLAVAEPTPSSEEEAGMRPAQL